MIHLNTEKGLIKVESWDDIESIPGFSCNVNSEESKLKEIIGSYKFSQKVSCGLSNCRTPHFKGYIVVTFDGKVSNIGSVCGSKYFGVEFQEQSRIFDRSVDESRWRENIFYFLSSLDLYREEFFRYFEEATNVEKKIRIFKSSVRIPSLVDRFLKDCIRKRDGVIYRDRALTKEEKELEIARSGRVSNRVINERVSEIKGFDCLRSDYDIKSAFVDNIKVGLDRIGDMKIDELQYKDLRYWSDWCSGYKGSWEKALEILLEHKTFLERENLKELYKIQGLKDQDIKALNSIVAESGI